MLIFTAEVYRPLDRLCGTYPAQLPHLCFRAVSVQLNEDIQCVLQGEHDGIGTRPHSPLSLGLAHCESESFRVAKSFSTTFSRLI